MEKHIDSFPQTDEAALRYVKREQNAYVVNLHQVVDRAQETEAEAIFREHGTICYKKELWPTYTGYVNLKRLSYDAFWGREKWVGTTANRYAGARLHAKLSRGDDVCPLRVYVFVSPSIQDVAAVKAAVRALVGVGNYCIHINDTHEEAVWLAETYFNGNSWAFVNRRSFDLDEDRLDAMIRKLKTHVEERHAAIEDVCVTDEAVLTVFGLGKSDKVSFLCRNGFGLELPDSKEMSSVDGEALRFYSRSKDEIIGNPDCHFYYRGVKFVAPSLVREMKLRRRRSPGDEQDVRLLGKVLRPRYDVLRKLLRRFRPLLRKVGCFLFDKERHHEGLRTVIVMRVFRFSYRTFRHRHSAE